MSTRSYLIVGHGGQGVLDLGNFLCYDAMLHGLRTAYTPSYGPETRGGKVRCYVVTSNNEIDSPIVDQPDMLIAMNNPSMDFEKAVKPNGLLMMNTSLIDRRPLRRDLEVIRIPATDIADKMKDQTTELSDTRVLQNTVMYGAVLAALGSPFDENLVRQILEHVYLGVKARLIPANLKAITNGFRYVRDNRNGATDESRSTTLEGPVSLTD